ncbi:hypothetical protein HU200_024079 [Digitaria exilis]|uniref:Uncharacterized protein n=1 Tax=Digitaria exilis TaxID=1010633 RepID=A0A835BY02_9POAL|nr:hypothetical protein HU200_024079 [Digitaria exilis]
MATAKENVPLAPKTLPRQTSSARPAPPPQRPNKAANVSPAAGGGILKCACFRLPSRSKNKQLPSPPPPPPPPATKLRSASHRGTVAPDVPAVSHPQSQRVTFRASASLTTWWPASPSASAGASHAPGVVAGGSVAPRRASASAAPPRASSSTSFSHWRRSVSSRVTPHGERASFSFHTSPASASSSCMSTPKIPHGCQQQG